ncbi:MAG: hypothetical protein HY594_05160 [Candidatus Omnitrophica bacterium]|nr:hypothetical protein [Candidatus Omnitrophota bacterium]
MNWQKLLPLINFIPAEPPWWSNEKLSAVTGIEDQDSAREDARTFSGRYF